MTEQEQKDYERLINSVDYPEYLRELIEKKFIEKYRLNKNNVN